MDSQHALTLLLCAISMADAQTTQNPSCNSVQTQWLEWSNWSDCTDTCGSCGIHMRTRVCLTPNTICSCEGIGTQLDYCNLDVCRYPRVSCCFNRTVQSYQGRFACLPPN
ncbi:Protein F35C11.7 [Aphelenchoides avenae]|nr:Protein F35C11.7 [Aphelenchus avenae]